MTSAPPADRTWRDLQRATTAALRDTVPVPDVEARWIIEGASGLGGAQLVGAHDDIAPSVAVARVDAMVDRRLAGEPIQYVLGAWAFRGLDLFVDPRVLIPRPETEVTAQVAIDEAERLGARRGRANAWAAADTRCAVADLGTGSGAIALALATELADAAVWGTDASASALAVARANLVGIGASATRVRLAEGDWFAALPIELRGRLRLVVSNPPYVAESEIDALPSEVVDHEPRHALVSGPTGFEAIERIIDEARTWLESRGALVVEIAPHQSAAATDRARTAGYDAIRVEPDLTGRDRVLVAHAPDESDFDRK